jgi:CHASE3 domain sensor protein/HAMP domain-containing protein
MRWKIRKSFKILAPGSSLRKRVAYSLAIVRLILVPVILFAVYYLFAMGRVVDRIVNVDAPAAKLAEQASMQMLEARRAARNYILFQDPEYLETYQKSLTSVRQILVRIGDLEPDEEATVQQALEAVALYQQRFAVVVSTMAESRQEPVERIREAVLAQEKDLDDLVKEARHEKQAQLIQELRNRFGSLSDQVTGAIQVGSPTQVSPELRSSSEQILHLASELEERNWSGVQVDHEKGRQLIHRAERSLSIVSAITLVFSVWVSFVLPRQVIKPLVSLKEAVDHAATGNYEVEFELHGGGEIVELAESVQNLTSLLRRNDKARSAPALPNNFPPPR